MNIHRGGVLTALAWLVPQESAARESQSRRVLCTPYNHAPCHFMQSHIRKVYTCLAVTCHLHFWQNDRDLLRATAVTRGWNGYRNKSVQKVDPGEEHSPAALQGFEPATFQSRVRRSNHLFGRTEAACRWQTSHTERGTDASCGQGANVGHSVIRRHRGTVWRSGGWTLRN